MIKKGIILAGGTGSRLSPLTLSVSKQLLPLYDKPMIYYSLSVLMLANIKDILIIVKKGDLKNFEKLLGNGKNLGIKISFIEQDSPRGLPDAFIIAEKFISKQSVMMILGDNFFYGQGFGSDLFYISQKSKPTIFIKEVDDPENFGVAKIVNKKIIQIKEKPKNKFSKFAITGLYIFDKNVSKYSKKLKPSKRGELEITDLIKVYLKKNNLNHKLLGRGLVWKDSGQIQDLHQVSNFISSIQNLQNILIGSIEEISLIKKWITKHDFKILLKNKSSSYYESLKKKYL